MREQNVFESIQSFLAAPVAAVSLTLLKWISAIVSIAFLSGIIYVIIRNMQSAAKERREKEERLQQQKL
ncbi:hypothetical protein HY573_00870 [Candidatus Parcubacteria bacterium]|uniref:Uncharacterized protein n=1 Tax=Candidatus Sungiibacteriota bacterium TaxID=2750080 RepID=A0A932YXH7_9BACT|nr:hypothetical protein [Candidatus Parcubacteria bacterium]MBI4132009.1 hypothetical protein [Candidatus Sungbacteria bacterium]MBI4385363.1 hypothetical protein [Candidatus Parcubacteria bacterium]